MGYRFARRLSAAATLLLLLGLGGFAEDWPSFLGPQRDGRSAEVAVVDGWLESGLAARWSIPLGVGYSGVAVRGSSLFTMDRDGDDEYALAVGVRDGRERWRVETGRSPGNVYGGLGPRVTPTVDGDRVFLVSAGGRLLALQAESGRSVWERDLARDLGWRPPAEGAASSPLVADGRVYTMVGAAAGTVAAFDRETGATLWTAVDDHVSYSSPLRWDGAGVPQVLFLAGTALFSLDPVTGDGLWRYPWTTYDRVNVATPLPAGADRIFISSGYDQGAAMLRVARGADGRPDVEEVWRNREMKNHFNNSVYSNGVLFGFDDAVLKAVDAASGQRLWRARGFGKGSLVLVGEHLIVLSDAGELACVAATPDALHVKARTTVVEGRTWTPPSIANGSIYVRGQHELVRLSPDR